MLTRAYANHGRWIIECQCRCAAQPMQPEQRWKCPACGAEWTVLWPADMVTIMHILVARPQKHNRNWQPGETIRELAAENIEHGCPVPTGLEVAA